MATPPLTTKAPRLTSQKALQSIVHYYSEASNEYEGWSSDFNMHFGYYEWGMNPFDRETMLEKMNQRVFEVLGSHIPNKTFKHILDMGCGYGATTRSFANQREVESVTGITIAPNQVFEAQQLAKEKHYDCTLTYIIDDYHHTQFDDATFDGIVAIESGCHSPEQDKATLLKEAYRLLKPNGSFVMADGFLKKDERLNPVMDYCYRKVCQHWALGEFGSINQVKETMEALGYKDIKVEDASMRVAPSVASIPLVATVYLLKRLIKGNNTSQKWSHLLAPVFLLPLAFCLHRFGYYIISGRKPE
ncbi:methyltransferase domain-containing protein [Pleionea sp. CnH1-48]|uniref:methyltransferase domain-containing protein n=1 Tax=Pleionea sp. CnH1-48 TaxID=2954494 RepID=UPI002096C39D|nr:methyltransferase domain-containing protein [Pleionea sp. CnH1-48]MCO7226475.1 methyltransferase domain-containing protein [Pleionea sp. CnH1-48]